MNWRKLAIACSLTRRPLKARTASNMAASKKTATRLTESYGDLRELLPGNTLHWLQELRDQSLSYFDRAGLPTVRDGS